jgi:DNA end-binding protein Ku
VLTMMRFSDELADLSEFTFPAAEGLRKPELAMARQLIEHLSADWSPEKYTDEYRENLLRLIRAKMTGRAPKLEGREEPRTAKVVNLMERLRASLEAAAPAKSGKGKRARDTRSETPTRRLASKSKKGARKPARRVA